jgi:hypothetical protein
MIIVVLLSPSYHFPEFSHRNQPVRFNLGTNTTMQVESRGFSFQDYLTLPNKTCERTPGIYKLAIV